MENIFEIEVTKIKNGKKITMADEVIREIKLEIIVNDKKIGSLMAVPVDLKELAVGYLMSEDIIQNVKDIVKIELIDVDTKTFQVKIDDQSS